MFFLYKGIKFYKKGVTSVNLHLPTPAGQHFTLQQGDTDLSECNDIRISSHYDINIMPHPADNVKAVMEIPDTSPVHFTVAVMCSCPQVLN